MTYHSKGLCEMERQVVCTEISESAMYGERKKVRIAQAQCTESAKKYGGRKRNVRKAQKSTYSASAMYGERKGNVRKSQRNGN